MITKASSDSAVAEAAEEQLDAYIVKPFSAFDLEKRLMEVIKRKMQPSTYIQKIREGKDLVKNKQFVEARPVFSDAKKLSSKPTLACFYLGDCFLELKDFTNARKEFSEGRSHNELHYKCLTGEFDCLM